MISKYAGSGLLAVLAASMLVGCSSVQLDKDGAPIASRDVQSVDAETLLNDPNGPLAKRSIYFDFDSFTVDPEYIPLVTAHSNFLTTQPQRKIRIEGNTDERGGREYNLALGQKRAEAVKQRMRLLGVNDEQIETISFGKEKPRVTGSTEEAWAQNRRADIQYQINK